MWVASTSINSFKGMLDKIRKTRMGFLWILHGPQRPRPHGNGTPMRPHKVSYKVRLLENHYIGAETLGMTGGDVIPAETVGTTCFSSGSRRLTRCCLKQ